MLKHTVGLKFAEWLSKTLGGAWQVGSGSVAHFEQKKDAIAVEITEVLSLG